MTDISRELYSHPNIQAEHHSGISGLVDEAYDWAGQHKLATAAILTGSLLAAGAVGRLTAKVGAVELAGLAAKDGTALEAAGAAVNPAAALEASGLAGKEATALDHANLAASFVSYAPPELDGMAMTVRHVLPQETEAAYAHLTSVIQKGDMDANLLRSMQALHAHVGQEVGFISGLRTSLGDFASQEPELLDKGMRVVTQPADVARLVSIWAKAGTVSPLVKIQERVLAGNIAPGTFDTWRGILDDAVSRQFYKLHPWTSA